MMKIEFPELHASVFTGDAEPNPYYRTGSVYQGHQHDGEYPEFEYTPAQARELAAALLRAADEAEGREPTGALARTVAVLESKHDPDEFADDPSLYAEVRGEAETIVRDVRAMVAEELEALPTYNDVADWCAHIGRRQAVDGTRNGRR
jgi:hypothetical protein